MTTLSCRNMLPVTNRKASFIKWLISLAFREQIQYSFMISLKPRSFSSWFTITSQILRTPISTCVSRWLIVNIHLLFGHSWFNSLSYWFRYQYPFFSLVNSPPPPDPSLSSGFEPGKLSLILVVSKFHRDLSYHCLKVKCSFSTRIELWQQVCINSLFEHIVSIFLIHNAQGCTRFHKSSNRSLLRLRLRQGVWARIIWILITPFSS